MRIGTVISSSVETNRDGATPVRMLQVQLADPDDVQSVEWAHGAGDDYDPPPGTAVIVLDLGKAWKVAIAADDAIAPSVLPGEREIYSHTALGVKQASILLGISGVITAASITALAGNDFVAIAAKVKSELSLAAAAGIAAGGPGAANFTAFKEYIDGIPPVGTPPGIDVASTNFKADK
jgi:hypothetical protein